LRVADHEEVYFEPGAGLVYPERCIATQIGLARAMGADVRSGETVLTVEDDPGGVAIVTDHGCYTAAKAVVAAGAWTGGLLGEPYATRLDLYRQAMHWFEPADPTAFAPERLPVFIWMHGAGEGDWFYGFPHDPGLGGVKIASEQFAVATSHPDKLDRTAGREEALAMYGRHVASRIDGLPQAWLRSRACVYTVTPASRFIIGPDPRREHVIVVSACSGHGFKHSPAIGEAVAELALIGRAPEMLAPFSPARVT
jgi:sarcosine oxidase